MRERIWRSLAILKGKLKHTIGRNMRKYKFGCHRGNKRNIPIASLSLVTVSTWNFKTLKSIQKEKINK